MRTLLLLLSFLFIGTSFVQAAPSVSNNVENIDLNLKDHEMAITFIGLSTGEATLILGPNKEAVLINIGREDTATELEEWLTLYDVKKLQTLILTEDGSNLSIHQINQLIDTYDIEEIITTPKIAKQLLKQVSLASNPRVIVWGEGERKSLLPDLTAEVQFVGNEQNEGLDVLLSFFKHRIFIMSSFSSRAEDVLLKKNLEDIHVFKVPNSTKNDSVSRKLIDFLNPQIAVLFTPEEEHPDSDILHHLHDSWAEVYFTKRHGTVTLKFTETKYEIFKIPTGEKE
jgi:competence protein ComEC